MHIAVTCPHCGSRYQLDPGLRGQRMRCPSQTCRQVFTVGEDDAAPAADNAGTPGANASPPPARQMSGSVADMVPLVSAAPAEAGSLPDEPVDATPVSSPHVGDLVPLVSAEAAAPALSPDEELLSWQAPPPVRGPAVKVPAPEPLRVPAAVPAPALPPPPEPMVPPPPPPPEEAGTTVLEPGAWAPPPVRTGSATPPPAAPAPAEAAASSRRATTAVRARRRARWLLLAIVVVAGLGALGGVLLFQSKKKEDEDKRYHDALAELKQRNYSDAAYFFRNLETEYPQSEHLDDYRFLAELCEALEPVTHPQADPAEARRILRDLVQFGQRSQGNHLLEEYQDQFWRALTTLADQLGTTADLKTDSTFLGVAHEALAEAEKYQPPGGVNSKARLAEIRSTLAAAGRTITRRRHRLEALAALDQLGRQREGSLVQRGQALVRAWERKEPGLKDDPKVQQLLRELPEKDRARVTYTPGTTPPPPPPLEAEQTSLVIVNRVGTAPTDGKPGGAVVLSLARGVLYGLDPADGKLRWARRVGVDATSLPVRVPRTPVAPERVLVLSADGRALLALEAASGRALWEQPLPAPCPGQPVVVGDRAFVPTSAGLANEVELIGGRLVGSYDLGQPLLGEAAYQPETGLLFVPADSFAVYVLDVARRSCAAILYTGHASGSLRGAPVVISEAARPGKGPTGYLIFVEADTLETTRLRAYALPVQAAEQQPLAPAPQLRGWSWFPPFHDDEKLALATDAGQLSLFGIRQPGTRDPVLFPIANLTVPAPGKEPTEARALVAHAWAGQYWVLSHGLLQKWQTGFLDGTGPALVRRWPDPLALGSPLHAAQVQPGENGQHVLFLTTQGPDQACLASAVEARGGRLRWQERLGLLCSQPLLKVDAGILAPGSAGELYLFEPGKRKTLSPGFALGGIPLLQPGGPPTQMVFRGPGQSVYVLAGSNQGEPATFTLRKLDLTRKDTDEVQEFALLRPFVGVPAVGPGCLVLPLVNGVLVRQPLDGKPSAAGPNWRAVDADEGAPGFVVWAGGDDFFVTDGSRKLRWLTWPAQGNAEEKATAELPERIVAPPVVLPGAANDAPVRVCLATAGETVALLEGPELKVARLWKLPGKITAGPFVRSGKIGCIVGRRRLVWLDPASQEPAWQYTASGDIVGAPQFAGKLLVIASLDGHFAGLDAETGNSQGPGYTLRANVAPAVAPIPWDDDLLFAPLTDGTVLLLPRSRLERVRPAPMPAPAR
jgi:outer membrane protein assembly factor BamB